ncbi:MAG: site-specific integrase [Candidatus Glassbacteria bacterium]|nr:site-specific integrase [Candidatus Glassbacteria bacterium]
MQAVISNTFLKAIKPADRPYEVRDTQLKGLILRVQPSGVMAYYVEYGRGRRINLGRADAVTPAQARASAKAVLAEAYKGGDPRTSRCKIKAHTLATFIAEVYTPWAEANIRTHRKTVARLQGNFPDLQDRKLADITPWQVEKWRTARLKSGIKKTTVNRDLDDLKSSLAKAVEWGLLTTHPIGSVKRVRVDTNPTSRFLADDEHARLMAALKEREEHLRQDRDSANEWRRDRGYPLLPNLRAVSFADHLRPMIICSLNTGLRRGELFGLTWQVVHLAEAYITVRGATAKSLRTRHVPLNGEAQHCLMNWKEQAIDADGLVFPGKDGKRFDNVNSSWRRILKSAGIRNFRWHDLRHDFASKLVMAGVDLNTVRELLGHADLQMTLRYAHLAPEHKAAAVARLVRV